MAEFNSSTAPLPGTNPALFSRFIAKVNVTNSCWLWVGARDGKKYGRLRIGTRLALAHRLAYEFFREPIPTDICVLHACDTPLCVNPSHLWLGTRTDNNADCQRKGRLATGDRNGARLHPDRLLRGDAHPARLRPERLARGNANGARKHPERLARGDRNGSRKHIDRMPRGEANSAAKLTEAQVRHIRQAHAAGETKSQLARRFGMTYQQISNIVNMLSWRHV